MIRLAANRISPADQIRRNAEDLRRGRAVDVLLLLEGLDQGLVAREVRQDAQLDLRVVRDDELRRPGGAMNARRISRPAAVRIGMFCRFGSDEESRPVAATVWRKEVCTRPCCVGERRQRVDVGALELGDLAVLEDEPGQRKPALGQLGQDLDARRGGLRLGRLLQDRDSRASRRGSCRA